jgi:uncharacterized protein (TIGR00369 family)
MTDDRLRQRSHEWLPPEPDFARLKALPGLDYLRELYLGDPRRVPIGQLMGFRPVRFDEGLAVFEGFPDEFHYNPIGTVHGGFAATMLDSAMGCAVHTVCKAGQGYTTVELKVNYIRPMTRETGKVNVEGRVVAAGNRIATAEGKITDEGGRLIAHGSTTCLIFPL